MRLTCTIAANFVTISSIMPGKQSLSSPRSRWSLFKAWVSHHKALFVFGIFIIMGALYLGTLWEQTRYERVRFVSTESEFSATIAPAFRAIGITPQRRNYCYYSSPTNEFSTGDRFCTVRLTASIEIDGKAQALATGGRVKQVLINAGFVFTDKHVVTENSVINEDFESHGLECVYDASYYGNSVPAYKRSESAAKTGEIFFADITCSGRARAAYFPIAQS